ncbi:1,2-phenylacetyl-CoA epoxidase subunit PaaC [Flavihumibacter solisilvae]|uniref:Phenylacetic acid degradation protein n=1 Tax=Flavihumibacter solisilvae TaxID=1349421 RepID=A0A0C1IXL3_9BACT|nr:1,2-phenylacetyl-CoA epoxidase subunit PaaC [Flavihumibacter solisilvae]KIC95199.1 phenylacetic acid degradation protein [Flavihumibacter solisilvae]
MNFEFLYTLHLADNALILGHRNSEWTGHGPILEQDIAISNIALDLIGQARNFYQYAATLYNGNKPELNGLIKAPAFQQVTGEIDEDDLAYLRDANEFYNCLLVEQSRGDWAKTILRQFLFSSYQQLLFSRLEGSADTTLSAIAEKSLKEITYHVRWSGEWVIRLGDGTEESRERMINAIDALWKYTGELFLSAPYEEEMARRGGGFAPESLKEEWLKKITATLEQATLPIPKEGWIQQGGKQGIHTEQLGFLLAEMQYLQRTYPNSEW